MGKIVYAGGKLAMKAPSTGIALSTLAEGSIVKLNENGSPVEFYVACHNYESGLNGEGRTLLVRKAVATSMVYSTELRNSFESSAVREWLNETYKARFDTLTQEAMSTTTIYISKTGKATMSVFILSLYEMGYAPSFTYNIGSLVPIYQVLRDVVPVWTRSPHSSQSGSVAVIYNNGTEITYGANNANTNENGVRPCFTIPATALFDEETLEFKGVS